MTNTILTDDLTKVYCDAWHKSFKKENPFHTVELNAETKSHIVAGLNAVLAELVQRAGVGAVGCGYVVRYERGDTPSTSESGYAQILGTAVYPPEAIAQLQARIEALSAEVEQLTRIADANFKDARAAIEGRAQLEAQGEAVAWLYTDAQSGDICVDTDPSAYTREVATGYMYKRALVLAPHPAPAAPNEEQFCYCNKDVSLQMVSGGAAPEGYLGRVTLRIGDQYLDYFTHPEGGQELNAIHAVVMDIGGDWPEVEGDSYTLHHVKRMARELSAFIRTATAAPVEAQGEATISTEHGPWVESKHPGEEGERYCQRCLLRDKFLGSRSCTPHTVHPPPPAAPVVEPSDKEILDRVTDLFPRWREDIQQKFVLAVARAAIHQTKTKGE